MVTLNKELYVLISKKWDKTLQGMYIYVIYLC
jgi:hypothetical protein